MLNINTDLKGQLPPFYSKVKDYNAIMEAEEAQLEALAEQINLVHDNYFPQNMDESTVAAWEQLLGIPMIGGETLDFRRQRVLARIATNPPFSIQYLRNKLDEILGPGNSEVTVDYAAQTMTVSFMANSYPEDVEIRNLVNQIKPAHIKDDYLAKFQEVTVVNTFTAGFGSRLVDAPALITFTRSLATYVNSMIQRGRYTVNGTTEYIQTVKTVSGNKITLTMTGFPAGILSAFAVMMVAQNVALISYTDLYVPVNSQTPVTQIIKMSNALKRGTLDIRYRGLIQLVQAKKEDSFSYAEITYRPGTASQRVNKSDMTMTQPEINLTEYTYECPFSLAGMNRIALYDSNDEIIMILPSVYTNPDGNVLHVQIHTGVTF